MEGRRRRDVVRERVREGERQKERKKEKNRVGVGEEEGELKRRRRWVREGGIEMKAVCTVIVIKLFFYLLASSEY